jgi:two-component system chemotaxis sensor kinase CheA
MPVDPYRYFRVEAKELLGDLEKGVLELEKGGRTPDLVARLLRFAHTLKGAARVVKEVGIAERAHAIEDALGTAREGAGSLERVDGLLAHLDAIRSRLGELTAPEEAAPAKERREDRPEQEVAVPLSDSGDLDAILDGVAEAGAELGGLKRSLALVGHARKIADRLSADFHSRQGAAGARALTTLGELRDALQTLDRSLHGGVEQVDRELREIREHAEQLRLAPVRLVFNAIERAIRDAATALGREVEIAMTGGEVRLDARVLSVVQKAFLHAARNAVAHGIEPRAERIAAGKHPRGRVTIAVERIGTRVRFACRDDGRGVDLAAVRRAAIKTGLSPEVVASSSSKEVIALLLGGGISTSSSVTHLAGRGIGLDVVRDAAAELGATVRLDTEPGRGTSLELIVPITLASLDVLLAEVGGESVAIPLEAVERAVRIGARDLTRSSDGVRLALDDGLLPFVALGNVLGREGGAAHTAIVLRTQGEPVAIGVERVLGTETAILRPLPGLLPPHPAIAGVILDLEGDPVLVLEPAGVAAEAGSALERPTDERAAPLPVLVVDDSMTTRMLEQSILESAGYSVELATSGEEALEKARERRYSLFLVDVEMPGMDGFTFIERTRADPDLARIPAVLVTSRNSGDDRRRGEAVGASGYIVKGEFDQQVLLDKIRVLVSS